MTPKFKRCPCRLYCNSMRAGGGAGPLCRYCDIVEYGLRVYARTFLVSALMLVGCGPAFTAGTEDAVGLTAPGGDGGAAGARMTATGGATVTPSTGGAGDAGDASPSIPTITGVIELPSIIVQQGNLGSNLSGSFKLAVTAQRAVSITSPSFAVGGYALPAISDQAFPMSMVEGTTQSVSYQLTTTTQLQHDDRATLCSGKIVIVASVDGDEIDSIPFSATCD